MIDTIQTLPAAAAQPLSAGSLLSPRRIVETASEQARRSLDRILRATAAHDISKLPVALAQPGHTGYLNITRPLVSVWGVALLWNCDENAVEARIQDGLLQWAFNIASEGTRNHTVRVFTRCVLDVRPGVKTDFSLAFVLNAIFPASRQRFRAHEVAYAFHCGKEHVRHLVKNRTLKPLPAAAKRDPASAITIARPVLADFLTSRRIA